MMKVLWIGVYLDGTGYGQAAIDYILSLDAAGIDVVCRPLKLNHFRHTPPKRILELQNKSAVGCDYVVQHCLPHQMHFNGEFKKNIALYASETDSFKDCVWAKRLNLMDKVWVINEQMRDAAKTSGVKKDISIVPHAINIEAIERSYQPLSQIQQLKDKGNFIFYFIGENVRRKNLSALIKAFHLEFDPSEKVELIIKTNGKQEDVVEYCDSIKGLLKLNGPSYLKRENIITDQLSDEEMWRLHASCDCLVAPSYGEAWHIPAFHAMALGKTPIVTNWGGFKDYLDSKNAYLLDYRLEPVVGVVDSFHDLYTGNELWASVSVRDLQKTMRRAFESPVQRKELSVNGMKRAYDFSYEKVGNLMKGVLESYEKSEALEGFAR